MRMQGNIFIMQNEVQLRSSCSFIMQNEVQLRSSCSFIMQNEVLGI